MGNKQIKYIGYEDITNISSNKDIILTVMNYKTKIFIKNTIMIEDEEKFINDIISNKTQKQYNIIIYGKNSKDLEIIYKKINQLIQLGFNSFSIYASGMLEYLLLRELFGSERFPVVGEIKNDSLIEFM
jgi:transcriptional antiterminator